MRERILLATGVNGTELLRSLARFGKGQLALRVMGPIELARHALMKSGISLRETYLSKKEETAIYSTLLESGGYFSASYADAQQFAAAMDTLRMYIPGPEQEGLAAALAKGTFREKNRALLQVYNGYRELCGRQGRMDGIELIRRALTQSGPIPADFLSLREFPVTPLERALLEKLSGGSCREISLAELFEREQKAPTYSNISASYGRSNEVENILGTIYEQQLPLDRCVIAAASASEYAQLFYEYSLRYNIPMNFGCGIPMVNANPAGLLKLYDFWSGHGYFGTDALHAMVDSQCFNRSQLAEDLNLDKPALRPVLELAGNLKLSTCLEENKKKLDDYRAVAGEALQPALEDCEKLSQRLAMGCEEFLTRYSVIREGHPGRVDRSALNVIRQELQAYAEFHEETNLGDLVSSILNKTVCSENSREGGLYITTLTGAMSSVREHLFVAGMSAGNFPGHPSENPLILDEDYLSVAQDTPTSGNVILRNKQSLMDLLAFYASLDVAPELSYSSYDAADLKEDNPSSVLFELFRRKNGSTLTAKDFEKSIVECEFFTRTMSLTDTVGKAYADGASHIPERIRVFGPAPVPLDTEVAATHAETFRDCSRKYFLQHVLHLEKQEETDPFQVIDPKTLGSLVHEQMELLRGERPSKEEFLALAGKRFDDYLCSCPPLVQWEGKKERQNFLRMAGNGYDMDSGNEVVLTEEKIHVLHPAGIHLQGKPDRVEKLPDGTYQIVDFKTGRRVRHDPDDFNTCLQILIYAYLLEQGGMQVSRCEYWYLRSGTRIPCRYDDGMRQRLHEFLTAMREAMETGDFPVTSDDKDQCKFCDMKEFCRRKEAEADGIDESDADSEG